MMRSEGLFAVWAWLFPLTANFKIKGGKGDFKKDGDENLKKKYVAWDKQASNFSF